MKDRLLSIVQALLFVTLALSMVIPRAQSISFCNPMDRIMLVSCCHPAHSDVEDGKAELHRPNCCDDIPLPAIDQENLNGFSMPLVALSPIMPPMPSVLWEFYGTVFEQSVPMGARGPPPNPFPLFLQNRTLLI